MNITKINDEFSVSEQILVSDIESIAAQGFKSIMCNRPDGEALEQPEFKDISNVAQQHGLSIHYIPIIPQSITKDDVANFAAILGESHKPILAYCKTGGRCKMVWSLVQGMKQAQ